MLLNRNSGFFLRSLVFPITFKKFKPQWQEKTQTPQSHKEAISSLRFVLERCLKFASYDVRLSLRHLGKTKLVSNKVDSFKVTRTM